MYFRCATCHGSIWVDTGKPGQSVRPACDRCDHQYDLNDALAGRERRKLGQRARDLARREQIDLPGAYSALLGLIPLEIVRELGSSSSTTCRTTVTTTTSTDRCDFDPEFQAAIRAGLLTRRQAFERGNRAAFAQRLVNRHQLRRSEALDVADNRRSLLETLRTRDESTAKPTVVAEITAPVASWGTSSRLLVGGLATLVALGVISTVSGRTDNDSVESALFIDEAGSEAVEFDSESRRTPATTPPPSTSSFAVAELQTDPQSGEILMISGPNPATVLEAFCESSIFLEPIAVRPSVPASSSRRIGVIRDTRNLERPAFVNIVRDRSTGRWAAGDGTQPLDSRLVPDQLLSHVRQ